MKREWEGLRACECRERRTDTYLENRSHWRALREIPNKQKAVGCSYYSFYNFYLLEPLFYQNHNWFRRTFLLSVDSEDFKMTSINNQKDMTVLLQNFLLNSHHLPGYTKHLNITSICLSVFSLIYFTFVMTWSGLDAFENTKITT